MGQRRTDGSRARGPGSPRPAVSYRLVTVVAGTNRPKPGTNRQPRAQGAWKGPAGVNPRAPGVTGFRSAAALGAALVEHVGLVAHARAVGQALGLLDVLDP